MAKTKHEARDRRKISIRKRVTGTPERPRLTVFRSARHMLAQVVDDESNRVIACASTLSKVSQAEMANLKKTEQAKKIGRQVGMLCKSKGIESVVFDRNGYKFHGRVMALAAAARETGLKF